MKKIFVVIAAIALLYVLPVSALAEKLVFVTCEYPPHGLKENEQVTGSDVEIIREVCNRLQIESEVKILPWARAVKYVNDGDVAAIFSLKSNEERKESLHFSSEPVYTERLVIIARKNSGIKISALSDLNGKKIGVVREYSYSPEFDNAKGINQLICNDDAEMIRILNKNRIDMGVGEEGNLKFVSKSLGLQNSFESVHVLSESSYYIAFSKKALGEKGKDLAEKFSKTLRQLREEGFIQKIESKYF